MPAARTAIIPSVSARRLFGRMVARADGKQLALDQTIALNVHRRRDGQDPDAQAEVTELVREGWLAPDPDSGGWHFTGVD